MSVMQDVHSILLGYFDKQLPTIQRLYDEIVGLDVSVWEKGYVFALKTQQLFTGLEDLFKQIAKAFENHIEDLGRYHQELLVRLNTTIPHIRPALLSNESFILLDKIRAFRHFIRHGYGAELDEKQLRALQERLVVDFNFVMEDLLIFRKYIDKLSSAE